MWQKEPCVEAGRILHQAEKRSVSGRAYRMPALLWQRLATRAVQLRIVSPIIARADGQKQITGLTGLLCTKQGLQIACARGGNAQQLAAAHSVNASYRATPVTSAPAMQA